jgi:FtsH-binding integral membrane protein
VNISILKIYLKKNIFIFLILTVNKWAYLGVSLVGTIGSLLATQAIDERKNPGLKYAAWTVFNGAMGLSLAPLYFMQPALLARAALMTTGVVGSISVVGMTARREQYLWLGAPLSKS